MTKEILSTEWLYEKPVRLGDTDATGAIYFIHLQRYAIEIFEEYMAMKGYSLDRVIKESKWLCPIVHSEATYLSPIQLGDCLQVRVGCSKIGNSSFTLIFSFYKDMRKCAWVKTTHVTIDPHTKQSFNIPEDILTNLLHPLYSS